jgi:hypothetical protein
MNKFQNDLKFGQKYEKLLLSLLPHDDYVLTCGYCKEYDFKLIKDDKTTIYEVKADRRAINTRNATIEFECNNKPSGIQTTIADVYAYFVCKPMGAYDLYLIPTCEMRQMIVDKKYKRLVRGGDGYKSHMYLIGLELLERYRFDAMDIDDNTDEKIIEQV